jgi:NAD(P)-dependent dehydrogenase (short-subunit alcohol dehydrogenase family)
MRTAVVIGSSGGLGNALARGLVARGEFERVIGFSRRLTPIEGAEVGLIDLADAASIKSAAELAGSADLVIVATGLLHGPGLRPERSYRELDAEAMLDLYRINTIGPALVAQAFLPLLPKDRAATFAVLSARVGSISDNRLGGWHSYRASKAALNMLVRNFAIELARTHPRAICVSLHPGTVDTKLSRPFQRGVKPEALQSAEEAAAHLLSLLEALQPYQSGSCVAWDGQVVPA